MVLYYMLVSYEYVCKSLTIQWKKSGTIITIFEKYMKTNVVKETEIYLCVTLCQKI